MGTVTEHRDRQGRLWYRARLTVRGRRRSLGLHRTERDAWAVIESVLAELGEVERGYTIRTWGETWLIRRDRTGVRGIRQERSCWDRHVMAAGFADWPVHRIKRTDVVRWLGQVSQSEALATVRRKGGKIEHRGLGRTVSRQTVKHALKLLQLALEAACDAGHVPANPALGVRVPRRKVAESEVEHAVEPWTYMRASELDALLALPIVKRNSRKRGLYEHQRAIFVVAAYTGLRAGELWGLRWCDVDLDAGELTVRRSYTLQPKSGKPRTVPLLGPALDALKRWREARPRIGTALVWPGTANKCHAKGYTAGWPRVWGWIGDGRRCRFHDLRHTCASHLVMGTWGRAWRLDEVRDYLGHSSASVTERYAHLAPDRLRAAVRETAAWQG